MSYFSSRTCALMRFGVAFGMIILSLGATQNAAAQTPQINLPDGFEIAEEARIEFVELPDGRVIERHIPARIRPKTPSPKGPTGEYQARPQDQTPPIDIPIADQDAEREGPPDGWTATPVAYSAAGFGSVWFDPVIPVCWESADPAHAQGRAWTREAVEASWEDVSQIDFTGWRTCTPEDYGIRIGVDTVGPHVAALGRRIDGMENGMVLNFTFERWGTGCTDHLEYCIKALAVHEFGHAIGLAHEHNRGDRTLCETEPQGPLPAFLMTTYDPASVMNYCAKDWNNNGRLSALDVAGVRLLYGPYTDETPALVELDGALTLSNADFDTLGNIPIIASFELTNANAAQTLNIADCLDDDLWVEATVKASLAPGESKVSLHTEQRMYETTDCQPSTNLVMTDEDNFVLVEPGQAGFAGTGGFVEFRDGEMYRTARFNFGTRRSVGETTALADCTSCVAAAEEAAFTSGPAPLALSGTALHGTTQIASPWPDDLNVDFELCANTARETSKFGDMPWQDAQIDQLCSAAPASKAPALCFAQIMEGNVQWGGGTQWVPTNALNLCAGSADHTETIACFSGKISAGSAWPEAIDTCKAN